MVLKKGMVVGRGEFGVLLRNGPIGNQSEPVSQ